MKKLIFILCVIATASVTLLFLAFYCIDLNVHKSYAYDIFLNDKPFGSVNIDRYVTEDKVIFKGHTKIPNSLSYSEYNEKLFLKRSTLGLIRYIEEATCGRGISRVVLLTQNNEFTDYLYLEYPKFFTAKGFETGEKTMVYSPYDPLTYMSVIEKYNFWKKGTQYFEVMTPADDAIPLMRDKIEVRELGDVYVQALGRKVEAEYFAIKSKGLPETKITLAKYSHTLLSLEVGNRRMKYVIRSYAEDPARKLVSILKDAASKLRAKMVISDITRRKQVAGQDIGSPDTSLRPAKKDTLEASSLRYKESFFDGGGEILLARMWIPEGQGPFPAVLFIPKDGFAVNGEEKLIKAYGEALSSAGYATMTFDNPGQGKSQGNIFSSDDGTRINNITAAVLKLQSDPLVEKDTITLMGHQGGAYVALEAAKSLSAVRYCVALMPDIEPIKPGSSTDTLKDKISSILSAEGFGPFSQEHMALAAAKLSEHLNSVSKSTEGVGYFSGIKTPMAAYRKFLERKPLKGLVGLDKPVFLIFGKNGLGSSGVEALEALRVTSAGKDSAITTAIFNNVNTYLGKISDTEGKPDFTADQDVVSSIKEWLGQKHGAAKADLSKAAPYSEIKAFSESK